MKKNTLPTPTGLDAPVPPQAKRVSVVERRLKSGSIFAVTAGAIPLKQPDRWTMREVNSELRTGRIREMLADKAWQWAEASDLAVDPYEVGYRLLDGKLVKGPRGELVLMKMEKADFREIQMEKDRANRADTYGARATKQAIVNAATREDRTGVAAEYLEKEIGQIKVIDSVERVSLE